MVTAYAAATALITVLRDLQAMAGFERIGRYQLFVCGAEDAGAAIAERIQSWHETKGQNDDRIEFQIDDGPEGVRSAVTVSGLQRHTALNLETKLAEELPHLDV